MLCVVAMQVALHQGMQVQRTRVLWSQTRQHALPVAVLRPAYEAHVDAMPRTEFAWQVGPVRTGLRHPQHGLDETARIATLTRTRADP